MIHAVIKTGGKQYVVHEGKQVKIEKIAGEPGDQVKFDNVLLVSDEEAKNFELGTPTLGGQVVSGEIMAQAHAPKIRVTLYKNKTRYHKVYGHKQAYTQVKITAIGGAAAKSVKVDKPVAAKPEVKKAAVKKPAAKKTAIKKK